MTPMEMDAERFENLDPKDHAWSKWNTNHDFELLASSKGLGGHGEQTKAICWEISP